MEFNSNGCNTNLRNFQEQSFILSRISEGKEKNLNQRSSSKERHSTLLFGFFLEKPKREYSGSFQNKSVSPSTSTQVSFVLAKLNGEGRLFGVQKHTFIL